MARSFYKGENLGSVPACAICVGKGRGRRAVLHLPCGVRVWLCEDHRSDAFLTARAGRDIVTSLMHVWRSADCLTARRARALDVHRARLSGPPPQRARPGSYSWPALRAAAEAAFARGERPAAVIRRLRRRARPGDGVLPSQKTMQRWFREGRWLGGGETDPRAGRPGPGLDGSSGPAGDRPARSPRPGPRGPTPDRGRPAAPRARAGGPRRDGSGVTPARRNRRHGRIGGRVRDEGAQAPRPPPGVVTRPP